jgi:hypothetical protein
MLHNDVMVLYIITRFFKLQNTSNSKLFTLVLQIKTFELVTYKLYSVAKNVIEFIEH